jgi:hypothetical protein
MVCRLSSTHRFHKVCPSICSQELLLFCRDVPDFATPTSVDRCKFGGNDMWCGWWGVGRRFTGKKAGDKVFLEGRGPLVGDYSRNMDMSEELMPHRARHDCYRSWYIAKVEERVQDGEMKAKSRQYPTGALSISQNFWIASTSS